MGTLVVRLILVLSLFVAAASAQSIEVNWTLQQPLSADDQRAILDLAARVGIRNPGRTELFRIRDGDWFIDVILPSSISYDDAERVIHALRRRTYVDVRQGRAGDITDIDLNRITRFRRDDRMAELFPEVYAKTFHLYADNYKWAGVRIHEGQVEFQGVSDWVR